MSVSRYAFGEPGTGSDQLTARAVAEPRALTNLTPSREDGRPATGRHLQVHGRSKRALDIVLAAGLLAVLAPVLVCLAIAVGLSSSGPIIFRQQRVGRGNRPFTMLKFRSMVSNAEDELSALGSLNEADGPLFKVSRDPRITPLGRWMRRYSLDELPQLLNVLGGSMSLVGPRPALPVEVAAYSPVEQRRLWVKPGLTGLWQVSGRSDLGWREGIDLDLAYVEHCSLALDLRILLRTLPAVVLARGAY